MAKKYQLRILGALLAVTILAVVQLVSAGNQMLTFSVTYGRTGFDTAYSLAWAFGNPNGTLYVVGSSSSPTAPHYREGIVAMIDENLDLDTLFTVKGLQSSSGWVEFYDVAVPIGISLSDTIAVVGYVPDNNRDPVVYWLDKDNLSTILAYRLIVFSGSARDEAVAVSFDSQGNTIVAGFTDSGVSPLSGRVPFLVKFGSAGNVLWSIAFEPSASQGSYVGIPGISGGLAIDCDNNIIVAGSVILPGKDYDAFVAKFNPNGGILWYKTFGGSKREHAYGVALDNFGNIYVTGATNSFSANYDSFVARFDPNGNLEWFRVWDIGNAGARDEAYSIAVIQYDHIYITGVTFAHDPSGDMFFAKIAANGDLLYVIRSNMAGEDRGFKVALNIHSTNDVFYVNIAGISNADPISGPFTDPSSDSFVSASFTLVTSSVPVTTHTSFDIQYGVVATASSPDLDTESVNSPDNVGARAMVLKFDPPSIPNENKNSIPYVSYLLIAAIITLIALFGVFIKRKKI